MGNVRLYGATSGYTELAPPAVAPDGVLSLPSGTGTIAKTTDQGLVHINTTTFSAVSSVSIDSVFTSTYQNYRIMFDNTSASEDMNFTMRLRVTGSDNSTNNYNSQIIFGSSSTAGAVQTANTSSFDLRNVDGAAAACRYINVMDLFFPQSTERTLGVSTLCRFGTDGSLNVNTIAFSFSATTSFDGFTVIASAGTMSGNIRVYGYKNS